VDECKPLPAAATGGLARRRAPGAGGAGARVSGVARVDGALTRAAVPQVRGLHSSTSLLNLSRVCHKKTPYTT